ncbi:hypothetical protein [Pigmentiphaga sp. CHJ604]|uniref:hypothetical protein n=1 Tax=Pigmentiphaga sp. CHJ604 TaxID=3081984 RepID=UPI0030D15E29
MSTTACDDQFNDPPIETSEAEARPYVPGPVQEFIEAAGGKVIDGGVLPDGSGFAVASMPLPKDHWLTQPGFNTPPMPMRMGAGAERERLAEMLRAAGRYAVRCATMNGQDEDFDPDALVQNLVVGALGYWTDDGLSGDSWANPDPVPPLFCPGAHLAAAAVAAAPLAGSPQRRGE